MSTLLLVRHAQASFLEPDYDKLSELGQLQARLLGEHWANLGQALDAVLVGPRRRHRETADAALESLARRGVPRPAVVVVDALDEYPADEVLRELLPSLASRTDVVDLIADTQADDRSVRGRALDRLLQIALFSWASLPDSASLSTESFTAFTARVDGVLDMLLSTSGRGERIAAFSSAGTIGALVGHTLGVSRQVRLELGFMLNNAAVSEVVFSAGRASLSRFNGVGHLADPSHWTRR